jgi:multiple sugar transport system substrate-binding protein
VTIKPADRLLFIIALAAMGITLIVRLGMGKQEASPPPEPLRLSIGLTEESGLSPGDLEPLIAEFQRDFPEPGIDIAIGIGKTDAEGGAADILVTAGHVLAGEISAGAYLPLDQYLHSETPLERWALPLVSSMDVFVYNIPLLKEAGFDRPPRTRTELLRYAQAIKTGDCYGLAFGLSPTDTRGIERDIFSWLWASGLSLLKDGKPEFNGRGFTTVLEFFSRLNQEELIAPGSFTITGSMRIEEFIRGRVAMLIVPIREIQRIHEKMGEGSIGITLVPQADDYVGKPVFGLSSWYAGIGTQCPNPDKAWELLRFMRENSFLLAETLALVPGTGGSAAYVAVDPLLDKAWDMYEAADTVQELLGIPGADELERIVRRELEIMFRDSRDPEETAASIRQQWGQQ